MRIGFTGQMPVVSFMRIFYGLRYGAQEVVRRLVNIACRFSHCFLIESRHNKIATKL